MSNYYELIPDASNLIESQRSVGYTFETAIADIIDNSISAYAKEVNLVFDSKERFLSILDDGQGMSLEELLQAMKYGSKSISDMRPRKDLGRFGLGLKMASFSQCRKLTVVTVKDGKYAGAIWDLDLVKKTNEWTLQLLDDYEVEKTVSFEELKKLKSGTIVTWEKFDKLEQNSDFDNNFDEAIERTENHVSLVFHRYLQESKLIILFNGRKIEPVDPFFVSNKATQPKSSDVIIEKNRKAIIEVKPYIIPYQKRLSQRERYLLKKFEHNQLTPGLYIYRNKRLIAWGKWFNLVRPNELANLAKIQIDIPNTIDDLWEIDVKKSQLTIPISVRNQLKNIIKKSIGESEKVYKYQGTKRNKGDLQYVFNRLEKENKVRYLINIDNPLIRQLQNSISDRDKKLLFSLIKQLEDYLPIESIQYDMASKRIIDTRDEPDDIVYEEIMMLLNNQTSIESKKLLLNSLKYLEVYANKKAIFTRIEGELND